MLLGDMGTAFEAIRSFFELSGDGLQCTSQFGPKIHGHIKAWPSKLTFKPSLSIHYSRRLELISILNKREA